MEVCDIFHSSVEASNNTFPYLMIATNVRAYAYVGSDGKSLPIVAKDIYNNFLQNDNFKKFPQHGGKGKTTKDVIRSGHDYVG